MARPIRQAFTRLDLRGRGERGYGHWLGKLAQDLDIPVALRVEKLQGSDPREIVNSAYRKREAIRQAGKNYVHSAILLDTDLLGGNPVRDAEARKMAERYRFHLIWQSPCHEAFLLRHFPGREKDQPPTCAVATERLLKEWPGYRKGLDGATYGDVLTLDHLSRARGAEPDLDAFLVSLGWN